MKTKITVILLLLFGMGKIVAQDYTPMLNNSSWMVDVYSWGGPQTFEISQNGEQIIGSLTYKKFTDPYFSTQHLLRENVTTKKIYKVVNGNDVLLFDFSLNVGNGLTLNNGEYYTVTSSTMINVNGGQRRKLILECVTNSNLSNEKWIEGVGSQEHPLVASYQLFTDPVYYLKCSFQNGENVFNQGLADGGTATSCVALSINNPNIVAEDIVFAPNPFDDELVISIESAGFVSDLKMYNSVGRLVKEMKNLREEKIIIKRENLPSGIYLIQLFNEGKIVKSTKVAVK